ncbi:alpha-L-rhamnosidase N-terminal domain-containing protein [Pelagicoccus mobilis]|uniref:Alpha-L-rhamnosidase N-terminal domain-containing protein n=1 Tax=Pelagicoccus mobilis TaxID=415221 RepID=A0A934RUQ3_9BACT|nr:alpha-L-rhamnosidase N-terminal domain-containing protein [Pelagicoccus mobilis]MBK1875474.1 alpha-L-rhamnosidase N-terminal domain-containing protein [Pelagicoccus mobilis]
MNPFTSAQYMLVRKIISGISLGVVFALTLSCQGKEREAYSQMENGVVGVWSDRPSEPRSVQNWEARWIWLDEGLQSSSLLARRSFELSERPSSARLKISATSIYELYVNGQYVARGPARCAPHHQSYDEFEVAPLLADGQNLIAVRSLFQKGTVSYHHKARAGLLVQLDVGPKAGEGRTLLSSGRGWKVSPDASWDDGSPLISRFHLESRDRVDLGKEERGWNRIKFDDSAWANATVLHRRVGWPSQQSNDEGSVLTSPWTALYRRDIPYLEEEKRKPSELLQAQLFPSGEDVEKARIQITKRIDSSLVHESEESVQKHLSVRNDLAGGDGVFLLYDFGEVVNGLPYFEIEGAEGVVVDVLCSPFVVDGTFTSNVIDSLLHDRVTLSGGDDNWRSAYFKPTRYLGLRVSGGSRPVVLKEVGVHQISYPFSKKGGFHVPESPWLEAAWHATLKTLDVCTTDAFTDNYRERRQYVQTTYYAALGNYWSFADYALVRRCLFQAAQEQVASGLMPAYAPQHGDDFMVILDSNTAWIRLLHDYFLYSGDKDSVLELLPAARRLMSFFAIYVDERGLLDRPSFSYWIDHSNLDRRGANFCINAHYLGALEDFAELLTWLGDESGAEFSGKADVLRDSLRGLFWNEDRGLFCDAVMGEEQSLMFSEHANGMALALGVATVEQGELVARELLAGDAQELARRESGLTVVTPAVSYLMHKGLAQYGYTDESLALLQKRFSRMFEVGTNETLWEEWWLHGTGRTGRFVAGKTRSDAQTESAFPTALFGEFLLGLRPTSPGLKTVVLSLPNTELKEISGSLPSPMGNLLVDWNLEAGTLRLDVPEGMQVQLDESSFREAGRRLKKAAGTSGILTLSHGLHNVRY